jgi:hypothetical protein
MGVPAPGYKMNKARITLLASQEMLLRGFLESHPQGHEKAAAVLFRRLHRPIQGMDCSDRYLAVDIVPFEDAWITDSSSAHVRFDLMHLRELFRRCQEEDLVFGFVHNHPTGYPTFSDTDEENERTLLSALKNRNGIDIHFVSMLLAGDRWLARIRHGSAIETSVPVRHTAVIGEQIVLHGYAESEFDDEGVHARQAAAFGQPFVDMLRSLRVAVIGGGGTGSPTITLLARAGVGEIVVIDQDTLAKSNLNRVRGAGAQDVGKNKARILHDFVHHLQLGCKVAAIESLIDQSPDSVDALSSCDVIFGCTDDQIGREILNTALYVYLQAYIDVGLGGKVVQDEQGHAKLRYHHGRVSTILPEFGECLFCQDVIRSEWIRYQYALRANPNMSEQEAKENYLEGGGEQAPGVGPFTSAIADYGVAGLFDLIRPFRRFPSRLRRDLYTIDFVRMDIRSKEEKCDLNCVYCRKREYLLLKEKYRLTRIALGKPNVAR